LSKEIDKIYDGVDRLVLSHIDA